MPEHTADDFADIPKVELHIHLEACVSIELARAWHGTEQAERYFSWLAKIRQTGRLQEFNLFVEAFHHLAGFIEKIDYLQELLCHALQRQKDANVVYSEITFSPTYFLQQNGWPIEEQWQALSGIVDDWNRSQEHKAYVLLDIPDDTPLSEVKDVLTCAERHSGEGIAGVNFSGSDHSPAICDYVDVLREACDRGIPLTVHIGEFRDADESITLLRSIAPRRIGHGTMLGYSGRALDFLKRNGISVELCLTSNLISGAVSDISSFPLRNFLAAEVPVSINTDDPEIFGVGLADEYRRFISAGLITRDELCTINTGALRSGFAFAEKS